ncbi:MAG: bile acid:sodium symporter, partial [Candidatus Binatia bacterium]
MTGIETRPFAFLARYWFLIALLAIVPGGVLLPEGGQRLRETALVLPALTAATLFISGFGLETSHLRPNAASARPIFVGLVSTYLVAPGLAYALARLVGPPLEGAGSEGHFFLEAVMIAAAQAGTIASAPALTMIAGGNQGLALMLTLASNVATVVLTPLVLRISLGAIVAFPMAEMVARMALVVLLPVVVGQCLRPFLWSRARRALPALRTLSQAIILVFVYTGVSSAAAELTGRPGMIARFVAVSAPLHLLLLGFVFVASNALRFPAPTRTALLFCGTQKTLPNGIYLWDRFFAANPHGAMALVVYHVFQLVTDTLLVPWATPGRGVFTGVARRRS